MGLGAGLDGSEKSRPLQSSKAGPSGPRRVAVPRQSYLGRSSYMKTKESLLYIEVVTFRLVVHQRKIVDSVIWNVLQYLDSVCHGFSVSVPRRESASRSLQMSSTQNDTRFQENDHLLRQIEHSTRCGIICSTVVLGPGSSVGIATNYGLDGPGIESRWGRDFPPVQTGPGVHPASCTMGTGSFPGVKCGRGVLLTTHPLLAPRS